MIARNTRLVMGRELRARARSKAFAIGLATTVLLIFGVFALGSLFDGDEPLRIGVTGTEVAGAAEQVQQLASLDGRDVEIVEFDDEDSGRSAVEDGDLDALVVDGRDLVMTRSDNEVLALVTPAYQQAGLVAGLRAAGLDDDDLASAFAAAQPLAVVELDPPAEDDDNNDEATAFAVVVLLFLSIQVAGAYIMLAVFEEKSSKVVELVLASTTARQLLTGKIVGIGVLGLVQTAALGGAALGAASLFTSSSLPDLSASVVGIGLVWFVLGFLLYGTVFAAGASLAPRQEDAQSTMSPITVVLMISYFAAIFSAGQPDSTVSQVSAWVPFTAPFAQPGRVAAGHATALETVGSMALAAAAASLAMALAVRIYERSVIHTDRKLGWREAWTLRQ